MLRSIDALLTPSERWSRIAELIFRVLTNLIFIIGGLGHFGRHQMMLDRMAGSPWGDTVNAIGDPSVLFWLSAPCTHTALPAVWNSGKGHSTCLPGAIDPRS